MSDDEAGSWPEVFLVSLRLGLTSFGGPVAHLGYQRAAFVVDRRWLSDAAFADLVALCQTLPGPASSQLSIAVGRLRAGWAGAMAAWLGFTLPSAVLMTLVGLWAAAGAIPSQGPPAGAIAGLKVAAVAVVAQAVIAMGRRLTPDVPRLAMAAVAACVMLAAPSTLVQAGLIAVGGLVGWVVWGDARPARWTGRTTGDGPAAEAVTATTSRSLAAGGTPRASVALGVAFVAVVLGSQAAASATGDAGAGFVAAIVRAGALVFGGGHVVLPLLDAGVVAPGWVAEDAFVTGYGAAQAVPGPLFTFASYLGVISSAGPGGVAGAAVATASIFLPGALLVLAALPVLDAIHRRPRLAGALRGVNAVVVGVLAAALVTPVGTAGIRSPLAALVAASGAAALVSGRVPPLAVVAMSALVMAIAAT